MEMTSETKLVLALLLVAGVGASIYVYQKRQKEKDALPSAGDKTKQAKSEASLPIGSDKALDNFGGRTPQSTSPPSDPFGPQAPAPKSARFQLIPAPMRSVPKGAHTVSVPAGTWWWMEEGAAFDAKTGDITNANSAESGVILQVHHPVTGAIVKVPVGAVLNTVSGSLKLPVSLLD